MPISSNALQAFVHVVNANPDTLKLSDDSSTKLRIPNLPKKLVLTSMQQDTSSEVTYPCPTLWDTDTIQTRVPLKFKVSVFYLNVFCLDTPSTLKNVPDTVEKQVGVTNEIVGSN